MIKPKYITNKQLLAEIHRSKNSYCHFDAPAYADFDAIAPSVSSLTPEFVEQTRREKASRLSSKALPVSPDEIDPETLVFRVMTIEHIPMDIGRKRRSRSPDDEGQVKTCFHTFKHYVVRGGHVVEVGRSHWKGDLVTGHFSNSHGNMTNRLAEMFILLVDRYSKRGNWRGYSYNDEMRNNALMQLVQVGLQFNEAKSDNPFAFYTQVIKNCFTRVLNVERKAQHIRDDLLTMSGVNPSYTRQVDNELDARFEEHRADVRPTSEPLPPPVVVMPKKRGRKPKSALAA